jgi:hypothetical protein
VNIFTREGRQSAPKTLARGGKTLDLAPISLRSASSNQFYYGFQNEHLVKCQGRVK